MEKTAPQIGDVVEFVDQHSQKQHALVTCVFGTDPEATINVVYTSLDARQDDSYGRQIGRSTSVPHKSRTTAPGYFWS